MSYKNKKYSALVSQKSRRKSWMIALFVILAILLVGAGIYLKFVRNHHKIQPVSASASTKGESVANNTSSSKSTGAASTSSTPQPSQSPDTNDSTNKQTETPVPTTDAALQAPEGDFVSSHHATSSTPEQSACTTTPGATCTISFTNGTITESLPSETTDRGGSAYWNSWTPQSLGLGVGNWTIQATATSGGQTKSAADALQLQVAS